MPDNPNLAAAWTYHNATKHSYTSIRTNPHFMDWSNQPLPFKIYPTLEPMRLPGEVRQTGVAALSGIAESVPAHTNASADLEAVARSEEHTSELQSQSNLVCRLLLEKKNKDTSVSTSTLANHYVGYFSMSVAASAGIELSLHAHSLRTRPRKNSFPHIPRADDPRTPV